MIIHYRNMDEVMDILFFLITNVVHSFKIFNCLRKSKYYDRMISSARVSKLEVSDPKSLEIIQRLVEQTYFFTQI